MAARMWSYWGKYQLLAITLQLSAVYSNSLTTGERYPRCSTGSKDVTI